MKTLRKCDFCGRTEVDLLNDHIQDDPAIELDDGLWVCDDCKPRLTANAVVTDTEEKHLVSSLVGKSAGAICRTMNLPYEPPYRSIIDAASRIAYDEDRFMSAWSFVTQWMDGTTIWRSEEGDSTAIVSPDGLIQVNSL